LHFYSTACVRVLLPLNAVVAIATDVYNPNFQGTLFKDFLVKSFKENKLLKNKIVFKTLFFSYRFFKTLQALFVYLHRGYYVDIHGILRIKIVS
jgi:hypothetical protein